MKAPHPSIRSLKIAAIFLVLAVSALTARCADTNALQRASLRTTLSGQRAETTVTTAAGSALSAPKPCEIEGQRVTYSGVIVQAVKAGNPLQLINPFAPEEYGNGEAHLVRDLVTHKANGIALFRIRF